MTAVPNAIQFEIHDPTRVQRARLHAVPGRPDTRSEPNATGRLSRILVATDGTAASEGAVVVAGLLARRHRATVDVVSVLPRWGQPPPRPHREFLDITAELLEERLAAVIPQGRRAIGSATPSWTIRVIDSSSTVDSIAETARREGHDLIVTGNRRGWITRWLRRPTAVGVAQRSSVPVLVVPQRVSTLPTRAVVGVEGTDIDLTAATTTVAVLGDNAAVRLVHVDTTEVPVARERGRTESDALWAARFAELESAIGDGGITDVHGVVLRGAEPAARLVAYAEGIDADLVVVGSRAPGTIGDRVSDGTRSRIVRASDRCVLLR